MEAGRSLLSSPPPFPSRAHMKNSSSSSSSVVLLHEQAPSALASMTTMPLSRCFPTSVLLQEQRDESSHLPHIMKEDRTSQETLDRRWLGTGSSENVDSNQDPVDFQYQLNHWPSLQYLLPSVEMVEQSTSSTTEKNINIESHNVVALAKKALSASKQVALLAEDLNIFGSTTLDDAIFSSLANAPTESMKIVRSTRLSERRSKKRKSKSKVMVQETSISSMTDLQRKTSEAFDPNNPLGMFLWGPETKQLLTAEEESELIVRIQDLKRLQEIKSKLQCQFNREPTLVEWAEAEGLSCQALKSQLHIAKSSREKLIYANFRMVVHIAKKYQGRGLGLQDLLQEGSMGLMRSVEKFKPQAGCRFGTYAYWWIRQAVRKAIFHHSRTIRLPDNVYGLLFKITEAKRLCIQDGHHHPTKEQIAARSGVTVEKLENILFNARMPLSMQQPIWMDQDTTFQEVTADTAIEDPFVSVERQLMRRHVRNLLGVLTARERKIIRLRFGIGNGNGNGKHKSLSEIGTVFGLSKERVRQLESRALNKLKQCLGSQGLDGYADLLI